MSLPRIRSFWVLLSLGLAFAAYGQQTREPPPGEGGPSHGPRPPMGERRGPPPLPTEELKHVLVLDAKQARSVDEIFRKHREQIEQLHQRTREQHESLARDTDERLRKVLSADQFKTFQEWKMAHRPPPHAGGPRGGPRPPHRPPHGAMPPDERFDAPPPSTDQRQGD